MISIKLYFACVAYAQRVRDRYLKDIKRLRRMFMFIFGAPSRKLLSLTNYAIGFCDTFVLQTMMTALISVTKASLYLRLLCLLWAHAQVL